MRHWPVLDKYSESNGCFLRSLFFSQLALLGDKAVEPGEALVTFYGAGGVDVPVEGFPMVTEAAVELAYEVGGNGEFTAVEALIQGAQEVAHGT